MKRKLVALSIALLTIFLISMVPVQAWVYPNGDKDSKFEFYGPHLKGIICPLYANEEAEWADMDIDHLDFEDWPLTAAWNDKWKNDPRFQLADYGGEAGYFILDINNNNETLLMDGTPNPGYVAGLGNPCSVLSLRQALAWAVNRSFIVNDITKGFGLPMWTPIPTYMTTFVHEGIKPEGALAALSYDNLEHKGNPAEAAALLTADDILYIPAEHPWRFWDKKPKNGHYDVGEEFSLIFYSRSDSLQRLAFADNLVLKLQSDPIKLHIDYRPNDRATCSNMVFGAKTFHMYTGGWIFIGPDPDYLYDLYHSDMYWHPGKPPNYDDGHYPLLDQYAEDIKFAADVPTAVTAARNFQVQFAGLAFAVPLWCASGIKAYRRIPVEEPDTAQWKGIVNQVGFGVNSWWTFLNLMKECEYYPPIYVYYGYKVKTIDWLNPVYAEWYWDWETIGKVYDSCAVRNPYSLGEFVPQLAKSWEVGEWKDPNTGEWKSKVRITLRSDLYWQDGYPVTTADLWYTFVESVDALQAKKLIMPWWYPTVQYFRSFYIIDPLNVEILLDVKSVFAVGWVIGTVVIPKHIWKPIIDASTPLNNEVHTSQPDLNVIGTGPYRFKEYTPEVRVVLDANTPGSVVNGIVSPGYYQFCPVKVNVHGDGHKVKFDPGFPNLSMQVNFTVELTNLWLNQCSGGYLIVNKYVYVDGLLLEGFPKDEYLPSEKYMWLENTTAIPIRYDIPTMKWHMAPAICTYWHELSPLKSWIWHLTSWIDTDGSETIDVCDYLDFTDEGGNIMVAHVNSLELVPMGENYQILMDLDEVKIVEYIPIRLSKCNHTITVAVHVKGPTMLDEVHPNPWICQWINVTIPVWITIKEDFGGKTYQGAVSCPDCKVDGKDVAYASAAFNTVPGEKRWNSIADVNKDYKVDGKDIAYISKYYGKW